jgi:hypothetical protein
MNRRFAAGWFLIEFSGKTDKSRQTRLPCQNTDDDLMCGAFFSDRRKNNNERKHERKINRTSALGMFYEIALGIFIKKTSKMR